MSKTILIVDDQDFIHDDLRHILDDPAYKLIDAFDGKQAINKLSEQPVDLLLLDLKLPRVSGMEVLRHATAHHPLLPVIIISGEGTIPDAVESTRLGAYDYIEKPIDMDQTLQTVQQALGDGLQKQQEECLRTETIERYGMIGASRSMQKIYELIDKAAASDSRVLIIGDQGTGKELVARAIHNNSHRADGPFIDLNCAAIPDTLVESELFGYERGAFTGANNTRQGSFELARQGTLFLDEIGDMSLMAQAKTLRTLEESTIQRLGGSNNVSVDVRVIAATNKDLDSAMNAGVFRKDLYYRLNVLTIELPPLSAHPEDITDLVHHFIEVYCNKMGIAKKEIEPNALAILMKYNWPGNIRELRNIIERLIVVGNGDTITGHNVAEALNFPDPSSSSLNLYQARDRFEEKHIHTALKAYNWRIQKTADALGITRTYLWKQIKRYGIEREDQL